MLASTANGLEASPSSNEQNGMPDNPVAQQLGDPELDDDPVVQLLLSGRAETFDAAEEMYLNENLPAIYRLLASPLSNEELARHPLIRMLYFRGSRGWEDSR
jgi:hypothetical protein